MTVAISNVMIEIAALGYALLAMIIAGNFLSKTVARLSAATKTAASRLGFVALEPTTYYKGQHQGGYCPMPLSTYPNNPSSLVISHSEAKPKNLANEEEILRFATLRSE